jgi:hypothetical protein
MYNAVEVILTKCVGLFETKTAFFYLHNLLIYLHTNQFIHFYYLVYLILNSCGIDLLHRRYSLTNVIRNSSIHYIVGTELNIYHIKNKYKYKFYVSDISFCVVDFKHEIRSYRLNHTVHKANLLFFVLHATLKTSRESSFTLLIIFFYFWLKGSSPLSCWSCQFSVQWQFTETRADCKYF